MNPLISVIVPIYKVENYIKQCIESIINQTYSNLEIILVDDGSPDNCGNICDEYLQIDSRIKVIHKENGGLSDARNAGLRVFKGEYLVFVDSDDFMPKDGIEYMYNLSVNNDADLVIGGTEKFDDNTGNVIWSTFDGNENIQFFNKTEAMKDFFINGCASWARLYKRSVHENVFFPVGEINEDEAIVLTILENCKKIIKSDKVVYNYRFRDNSITSNNFTVKKFDWCNHCKNNLEYISSNYKELYDVAEYRYYTSIVWALNNMTYDVKSFSDYIKHYRQVLKCILKSSKHVKTTDRKEYLRALLLTYFYNQYALAVKILNKHYT